MSVSDHAMVVCALFVTCIEPVSSRQFDENILWGLRHSLWKFEPLHASKLADVPSFMNDLVVRVHVLPESSARVCAWTIRS